MRLPSGFAEVPCARCGTFTRGIAFGELCPTCRQAVAQRANRIARLISLLVTAALAAYVSWRIPRTPVARIWAAIAVVIIYLLLRRITGRIALEALRNRPREEDHS